VIEAMRNIVLLTATITPPPNAPDLVRTNPADRLADYQNALRFYCRLLERDVFDALVVAENSNSDMAPLIAVAAERGCLERCEFLGFDAARGSVARRSRFSGEIRMMARALEQSRIVAENRLVPSLWV
jgi:hypothetical protein